MEILIKIYNLLMVNVLTRSVFILIYRLFGSVPWSIGYWETRNGKISSLINDDKTVSLFANNKKLTKGYGIGFDERLVEYPWLISKIRVTDRYILDAGSILNFPFIVNNQKLLDKKIIIANLNPEKYCFFGKGVSYVYSDYADIRHTCFRDCLFNLVICSSVLEHVGMDNSFIYSKEDKFNEKKTNDYLLVIDELRRLLKKDGRLLLTFPYGKYQNLGWLQQFDAQMVNKIVKRFSGRSKIFYYKYTSEGWVKSTQESCNECAYFDIHADKKIDNIKTAAARAVACIELQKV